MISAKHGGIERGEEDVIIDMTEQWNKFPVDELDVGLFSILVQTTRSEVLRPPSQATGRRRRLRYKQPGQRRDW